MSYKDFCYDDDGDEPEDKRVQCDGCGEFFYREQLYRVNGQLVCETCEREAME